MKPWLNNSERGSWAGGTDGPKDPNSESVRTRCPNAFMHAMSLTMMNASGSNGGSGLGWRENGRECWRRRWRLRIEEVCKTYRCQIHFEGLEF